MDPCTQATVELSESETFECSHLYNGNGKTVLTNLNIGTKYFIRVTSDDESSESVCFYTDDTYPRLINLDGVFNVRDIGGSKTYSEKTVKQGMLYRGSELNGRVNALETALCEMRERLRIKTVLDLRGHQEIPSALNIQTLDHTVSNVYKGKYFQIENSAYAKSHEEPEANRKIFSVFADENNYPIYFHCYGGADRTGTVAFYLEALLGVKKEYMIDDYESTSLAIWGTRTVNSEKFKRFIDKLNEFSGESLSEKVESFMLSSGITKDQINKIKQILTE